MRIIFFGTSPFAAKILAYLLEKKVEVLAVVTRPDRPKGRSLSVSFPPVKELSLQIDPNLPIFQPEKASTSEFVQTLRNYSADLFIVVAFGEIIKENLLHLPKWGCINIHASLLPKYRGAAPMQRCLMEGCTETGITIIDMVLQMDAGDILKQVKIPIPQDMTLGELERELCQIACPALLEVMQNFETGNIVKIPQEHSQVTFAPKVTPGEEKIEWNQPAEKIHNQIRALSPLPGAWCFIDIGGVKKRLKIRRATVQKEEGPPQSGAQPGTFLSFGKEGWVVACASHSLRLLEVQLEGKKAMRAEDFIKGANSSLSLF